MYCKILKHLPARHQCLAGRCFQILTTRTSAKPVNSLPATFDIPFDRTRRSILNPTSTAQLHLWPPPKNRSSLPIGYYTILQFKFEFFMYHDSGIDSKCHSRFDAFLHSKLLWGSIWMARLLSFIKQQNSFFQRIAASSVGLFVKCHRLPL